MDLSLSFVILGGEGCGGGGVFGGSDVEAVIVLSLYTFDGAVLAALAGLAGLVVKA